MTTHLSKWLTDFHPVHAIVDVRTDVHECSESAVCSVCSGDLMRPETHQLIDRHFTATVARILVLAKGYDPAGEVLTEGPDWPYVCQSCLDESREIMLSHDIAPARGWTAVIASDDDRAKANALLDSLEVWRELRKVGGL